MNWLQIELHKVKREICVHGKQFTIYRDINDKYGEKEGTKELGTMRGLFHTSKGYISESVTDGTLTHRKGQPKMLTLFEDVKGIKQKDYILLNGKRYDVIEVNNIEGMNIISDISLEVMLNGD